MLQILLACLIVMSASLAGAITFFPRIGAWVEKNIAILSSFAAGVFSVVVFLLISESVEHSGLVPTLISIAVGFIALHIAARILPDFHHHHMPHDESHTHSAQSATRILLSDAVHNVADGILIATAFLASASIGVGVMVSVFVHELIQGLTQFVVLRRAGFSGQEALIRNFVVAATILIGAIGSFFFIDTFASLETILLGLAAGGFLATLSQDLIPSSFRHAHTSARPLRFFLAFILGLLLMTLSRVLLGH